MNNVSTLIVAALPIVGIIIGAALQYFFSKSAESRRHLATLKTQAYTDYLRCVAESKHIGRNDSKARKDILTKAADAKTRISIYGSSKVVEALANFEKVGAIIDSSQAEEKFLILCESMRRESIGTSDKTKLENLRIVLFGSKGWNDWLAEVCSRNYTLRGYLLWALCVVS